MVVHRLIPEADALHVARGLAALVKGPGFRGEDLGWRFESAGFRVQGQGFRVQGSGCEFRVLGFGV